MLLQYRRTINVKDLLPFLLSVIATIRTELQQVVYMSALADGTIAVCSKQNKQWRLARFNVQFSREVCGALLMKLPNDMSEITLGGKHCIALSYK